MRHRCIATAAALAVSACSPEKGITVSGTVVSMTGGPIGGAEVYVGHEAPVTTSADGRFEVSGVETPYAIVAIKREGGRPYVSMYEGLTIPDPHVASEAPAPEHSAMVSGTLAGYEARAGHVARATLCAPYPLARSTSASVSETGAFEGFATWDSGPSTSLTPYALSYAPDGAGLPVSYDGLWSHGAVDVSSGANVSSVPLVAEPISSAPVTVSYGGLPDGYAVAFALPMERRGSCSLPLPLVDAPPSTFGYLAPDADSPGFAVAVVARNAAGAQITGFVEFALQLGERAKGIQFRPGVTLLSPEPLGSLALSTVLGWSSPVERPLSVVSLRPGPAAPARPADPTAAWIRIATSGTSANLVRLEHAGIDLHSGTSYVWAVETYEVGTVDDYARLSAVGDPTGVTRPQALASGIVARSETRQLRTP